MKAGRNAAVWASVGLLLLTACGRTEQGGSNSTGGASETGGAPIHGIPPCANTPAGCGGTGGAVASGGATTGGDANGRGGASVGSGGTGIAPPHPTSQVDLLLMIDNSISMADKQYVLADAVPQLLERLAAPNCIDANGEPTGFRTDRNASCAQGSPEFPPVSDLHIGVITSSLGAHGGQTCTDSNGDDKAQLVGKIRTPDPLYPYATWNDSGFLAWDPERQANTPPGESDFGVLSDNLINMVLSVGQTGCGYEASLEAWYRFLIDPDPPTSVPTVTDPSQATMPIVPADPAQNPVLMQRAAFLRPDSALVILMLSDENDCSIRDDGQGWLVGMQNLGGQAFRMPRSTNACASNPNDKCCVSCQAGSIPGCPTPGSDPGCAQGTLGAGDDNLNLRCFDQKRRFGFDLLYPLSRYVDGLTQATVLRRNGTVVQNPLFPRGGRTPSMVFLGGIVGVPWQDLATEESLVGSSPLEYLNHAELTDQGRWPLVLGDEGDAIGTAPTLPADKLMFETPRDRSTLFGPVPHPLLGAQAALAPSASTGRPNAINGHESNLADNHDLQYACIFALPAAKDCASAAAAAAACDCRPTDAAVNRALCNGTTQTHAKAYPSVRQLRVLKAVGDLTGNAVATSICPKTLVNSDSYGYGPAVSALVNTLKPALLR